VLNMLNQHVPGCALIHNSFALAVCWEVSLLFDENFESKNRKLSVYFR